LSKASAIIESILLGINLPPIFIFKRLDGVLEVIDGQQRLLTILGFIGQKYLDEDNNKSHPRNSRFSLRGLRILKSLNGKKNTSLANYLQDKILDFELLFVEIDESLNPNFNPVDLFIRLNDKPYPIRENSFEIMWNSWVERDVIVRIKENVNRHLSWFHLKIARNRNDRDRMENEKLYTSLVYLEFEKLKNREILTYLDIYKNTDRINARIRSIKGITNLLTLVSQDAECQQQFLDSIKNVESFIYKVRLVLLDKDIPEKPELMNYLKSELDGFYKARKESQSFKRTKQDFYILWYALNPLNLQMVKHFRLEIKKELQDIFHNMKNVPPAAHSNERGAENFIKLINNFHQKYKVQARKTKLSESEKENLIKQQGNRCAILGAPIFLGDNIEVDHKNPLALGGEDTKDNLQIAHKDSNRRKGASRTDTKLRSNVVDRGDKGDKGDKGERILSTNATSYELSPQESGTSSTDNSNAETI
jgi:5-methylcytosine-specific restriction endonuclease McrA